MNLWSSPLSFERSAVKYPFLALTMTVAVVTPALADPALANAKKCMGCHNVAVKVVGPSFKAVAAKYKADNATVDQLANKIRRGGSGVWGIAVMPANDHVNEAEARKLATWVLSLK